MANGKFRLITCSDFDGLACAVLLHQLGMTDDILFVHPKDMQDGMVAVTPTDITTNLPYVPGVHLAFDHHASETLRDSIRGKNHIIDPHALSAARVVYEYYGGRAKSPKISPDMMIAVEKANSAQFSREEILQPTGWVLFNYLMDARTGLGRFRDFEVSNYQLIMDLISYCADHAIDEILALPNIKERVELYFEHEAKARDQILRCSSVYQNVVVQDLREENPIYACNRFLIYALFPLANVSIHLAGGLKEQNTVLRTGKSILNRTSTSDIGALMLKYGGGGHEAAGTCQPENAQADVVMREIVDQLNAEEPVGVKPVTRAYA